MHGELGNLEGGLNGGVYPGVPLGDGLDFGKSPIYNIPGEKDFFKNFDIVAENFSRAEKIIDRQEINEGSILFQQNIAKAILAAKNTEMAKNIWKEYQELVDNYMGELDSSERKAEAKLYFNSLKRSVLGSVAVIKFFEKQGFNVEFPTIKQDGYKKCDLMFEPKSKKGNHFGLIAQIKSHHIPAVGKKEIGEIINKLILTDAEELGGKDQKDFGILEKYSQTLSAEKGKKYFPIFINMPVTREMQDGERRRFSIIQLVDQNGKINEVLDNSMSVKWGEKKKKLGVDKNA